MIRIEINLATRRYPGKGTTTVLPVIIAAISVLFLMYERGKAGDNIASIGRLEKRIAEISEKERKNEEYLSGIAVPQADFAVVSDILEKKGFSWIGALDNIEKALPSGVSLSSIQPSFKDGGAKLSGYARDFATLSRFIDSLEKLKVYKRVFLVSHSIKEIEDEKKAVQFNLNIEGNR